MFKYKQNAGVFMFYNNMLYYSELNEKHSRMKKILMSYFYLLCLWKSNKKKEYFKLTYPPMTLNCNSCNYKRLVNTLIHILGNY